MIVREKRADIVVQREKEEGAEGPGLVWMSPQSAKMETRKGRWSDVNRERLGVMKKANGSLLRQKYCCVEVDRETGQTKQLEEMGRVGGRRGE